MMTEIIRLNTIQDFCYRYGCPVLHPLVTIVDSRQMTSLHSELRSCGFYSVLLKGSSGSFSYGSSQYDHDARTLVFIAPDQVYGHESEDFNHQPGCKLLLFHPDLLQDSILAPKFRYYPFFSYESNQAVHMSEQECDIILSLFDGLSIELKQPIDKGTRNIVLSYLSLFFSYCTRFYDRQFVSRAKMNSELIDRFNKLLESYFDSDLPTRQGMPSVAYCARQLSLSPNYFGDLVKKMTGHNAKEHIHMFVVERVKHLIINSKHSISEIAYMVGFKYPHHLSRVFRHVTGITPIEFRTRR